MREVERAVERHREVEAVVGGGNADVVAARDERDRHRRVGKAPDAAEVDVEAVGADGARVDGDGKAADRERARAAAGEIAVARGLVVDLTSSADREDEAVVLGGHAEVVGAGHEAVRGDGVRPVRDLAVRNVDAIDVNRGGVDRDGKAMDLERRGPSTRHERIELGGVGERAVRAHREVEAVAAGGDAELVGRRFQLHRRDDVRQEAARGRRIQVEERRADRGGVEGDRERAGERGRCRGGSLVRGIEAVGRRVTRDPHHRQQEEDDDTDEGRPTIEPLHSMNHCSPLLSGRRAERHFPSDAGEHAAVEDGMRETRHGDRDPPDDNRVAGGPAPVADASRRSDRPVADAQPMSKRKRGLEPS